MLLLTLVEPSQMSLVTDLKEWMGYSLSVVEYDSLIHSQYPLDTLNLKPNSYTAAEI